MPEPMNKAAREKCLRVMEESEDAFTALYRLRDLLKADRVEDAGAIRAEARNIEGWARRLGNAASTLDEEDDPLVGECAQCARPNLKGLHTCGSRP